LNAEALLQFAEPGWLNWSHHKDFILGLADRLCHKIPNPNDKPVSDFQNLVKSSLLYLTSKVFP